MNALEYGRVDSRHVPTAIRRRLSIYTFRCSVGDNITCHTLPFEKANTVRILHVVLGQLYRKGSSPPAEQLGEGTFYSPEWHGTIQ